jgi:hypothetical protein
MGSAIGFNRTLRRYQRLSDHLPAKNAPDAAALAPSDEFTAGAIFEVEKLQ